MVCVFYGLLSLIIIILTVTITTLIKLGSSSSGGSLSISRSSSSGGGDGNSSVNSYFPCTPHRLSFSLRKLCAVCDGCAASWCAIVVPTCSS